MQSTRKFKCIIDDEINSYIEEYFISGDEIGKKSDGNVFVSSNCTYIKLTHRKTGDMIYDIMDYPHVYDGKEFRFVMENPYNDEPLFETITDDEYELEVDKIKSNLLS